MCDGMICTKSLILLNFLIYYLLFGLLHLDLHIFVKPLLSFEEGIVQFNVDFRQLESILHPIRNLFLLTVDVIKEGLQKLG